MDFKATMVDGKPVVKSITVKDDKGNVTVHVPSMKLIRKLQGEIDNGKRNIQ